MEGKFRPGHRRMHRRGLVREGEEGSARQRGLHERRLGGMQIHGLFMDCGDVGSGVWECMP